VITRVEATNYRCLRSVGIPLRRFQILVGPNGTGKTAFMDVLGFLRDFVANTVRYAVNQRTDNYHDLVWGRQDSSFSLAVEAQLPPDLVIASESAPYSLLRYNLSVRLDTQSGIPIVEQEEVLARDPEGGEALTLASRARTGSVVVHGNTLRDEIRTNVSPFQSALSYFGAGPNSFPILTWFAALLREGIRDVKLSPEDLHRPSTLQAEKAVRLTGTNLARSVFELRENSRELFEVWVRHLRTALPDLETVRTEPWPQEGTRHLILKYQNGIEVPARVVSDGTLCLLALTILAYLQEPNQVFLIEEPENAVHPTAVDSMYQSLSSLYDSQVLMASHSPILLSLAKPEELLCFARGTNGTEVVPGNEHPALQEWKGEVNLSDLFAAGVLG
jgi:predicted ATPase